MFLVFTKSFVIDNRGFYPKYTNTNPELNFT